MSDDPLNLHKLPLLEPPADLWNVIEARLDVRAQRKGDIESSSAHTGSAVQRPSWLPVAMAAAVSIMAIGLVLVIGSGSGVDSPDSPLMADDLNTGTLSIAAETAPPNSGLVIAQRASALLEQRLKQVRNGVVEAEQLDDLVLLESELGWVDELLIERPSDTRLWQQRVALLDQMSQRYAVNDVQSQMINVSY